MMGHSVTLQNDLTFPKDSKEKFGTFRAISDPYVRAILNETKYKAKSSQEISRIRQIPISSVYRRVQLMHDLGMLKTSGSISEDGKKFFLYKSKIQYVFASYDGELNVKIVRD